MKCKYVMCQPNLRVVLELMSKTINTYMAGMIFHDYNPILEKRNALNKYCLV